ncbi:unnamed protein product, partial [Rotaria magnacalcarata]
NIDRISVSNTCNPNESSVQQSVLDIQILSKNSTVSCFLTICSEQQRDPGETKTPRFKKIIVRWTDDSTLADIISIPHTTQDLNK